MQTKSVQKGGKALHQHKNADGKTGPSTKNEIEKDASVPILKNQTLAQNHHP